MPSAFWQTVHLAGAAVVDQRAFPDHHRFSEKDLREITAWAQGRDIVCTAKDAVKLAPLIASMPAAERPSLWQVPIRLQWMGDDGAAIIVAVRRVVLRDE